MRFLKHNISSTKIGFISRVVSLGSNMLVIPLCVKYLNSSDFSVWMLLVSMYSLVAIFDFGFSATISRYYSYAINGLSHQDVVLKKVNINAKYVNFDFLKKINFSNRKIFRFLIFLSVVVLFFFYISYNFIFNIGLNEVQKTSWCIFSLAIVFVLASVSYNGFIHGSGNIKHIYINTLFSNIVFMVISVFFLFLGYGLIGLAISRLFSSICLFFLNKKTLTRLSLKIGLGKDKYVHDEGVFRDVRSSALKLGMSGIGNFLSNRMTIYILSGFISLTAISGVTFIINILIIMISTCLIILNNNLPKIIELRLLAENKKLLSLCKRTVVSIFALFLFSYCFFVLSFPYFIEFLKSDIRLPSDEVLLLLFLVFFIELLVSTVTGIIATDNDIKFSKFQILSGVFFLVLCFFLYIFDSISVVNVLSVQVLSQVVYNAWKWPVYLLNKMKIWRG